jgi:hypothetical protein
MAVPYTFGTATSSIPLSQLDSNFNTVITLGNTAIQLGNTVTTLNNMTLANVTISSGNVTITNVAITTANVTTANITTAVIGTETVTTSTITTANVTTANITTDNITNGTVITSLTLSYGTANGVGYLNGSKVLTTGSALTWDETTFTVTKPRAYNTRFAYDGSNYTDIGYGGTNTVAPSNPFYYFNLNGSEQMRLTSTGLGIGTSSPAAKLNIGAGGAARFNRSDNATYGEIFNAGAGVGMKFTEANSEGFRFFNGATQAMTIDSSGNLLVGTTSGNARMRVVATASQSNGIYVTHVTSGNDVISCENSATTGNNVLIAFYTDATVARGSITYNRGTGLIVYGTTSDYRAKDIYGPVINSGVLIDSVPVYMGKMKDATQERPMFIAHETPAYAHTGEKDAVDADGNPVYQQMDASALIPVMWAEIQSLRKRLTALEST